MSPSNRLQQVREENFMRLVFPVLERRHRDSPELLAAAKRAALQRFRRQAGESSAGCAADRSSPAVEPRAHGGGNRKEKA